MANTRVSGAPRLSRDQNRGEVHGTPDEADVGALGADAMGGGPGNDIYFVDNLGDAVYENPNEGTDIVRVKVSGYTLPANVEIGAVNTATGLTLTGNNQGDILFGTTATTS
ncbi:MAG: hypothetical protein WAU53_19525 [Rhodoplanes sp.]